MRRRDSSTRSPQRSEVAGSASPPQSPAAGSSPPPSPPARSSPCPSPPAGSSPRQSPAAGSSPPHSPVRSSPRRAPAASTSGDDRKRVTAAAAAAAAAPKPNRSRSRSKTHSRSRSRSSRSSRSSSCRSRRSRSRLRRRNNSSSSRSSDRSSRGRSHSRSNTSSSVRVHVGNIGDDPSKTALMKAFDKFGNVQEVWLARTPPCFAFIVYRHREEAQRAVSEMNGQMLHGNRLKVSIARPRTRGQRGGAFNPYLRCYQCGVRGHFSRDCKEPERRQNYSSGTYIGACLAVLSYRVARQAGTRRRGAEVCESDRAHYGWYRECSKPGAVVVQGDPEEGRPDNPTAAPAPVLMNSHLKWLLREELDSIKRLQVFSVTSLPSSSDISVFCLLAC